MQKLRMRSESPIDSYIDFSNVALYLSGIQTIFAVVLVSIVSIISCWLLPTEYVSAIRTLAMCAAVAYATTRVPIRIGKVHGIQIVYNSLRPCVWIYLSALVLEQLGHSCSADVALPYSLPRFFFHAASLAMIVAGMLRAFSPTLETDLPCLVVSISLLLVAIIPPPAIYRAGPLCESASVWSAAERVARAFVFSFVYTVLVYGAAPSSHSNSEAFLCIARSASAALWTLTCHMVLLPLAIVQVSIVAWKRLSMEQTCDTDTAKQDELEREEEPLLAETAMSSTEEFLASVKMETYRKAETSSSSIRIDIPASVSPRNETVPVVADPLPTPAPAPPVQQMYFRDACVPLQQETTVVSRKIPTPEQMAEIAARIEHEEELRLH